VAESGLLQLP